MEDSTSISEREQGLIDFLVRRQGNWVAQVEIASAIGINKSNVRRIAERLQRRGQPIEIAPDGALRLDMARYRTVVRLDLHQSAVTFLATRLLSRYSDKPNIHAVEALLALGKAMVQQKVAQPIGQHIIRVSEDLRQRQGIKLDEKSDYVLHLEKITEAWAGGYKVSLDYQPLHGRALEAHKFQPYFLEPSAIGYSTYVIGKDETLGELRARKLERITGITTLPIEPFEIPPDFDPAKLLGGAWGIWFGAEDKQETVRLRFLGADIVRRVKESVWHPSQRIVSETSDELIWEVDIDAPQEMLPWVRGWGASVEVLEPASMREAVMRDVERMSAIYSLSTGGEVSEDLQRVLRCWGKTAKQGDFHPALYHMLDVGHVASCLLNDDASSRWRNVLIGAFGWTSQEVHSWVPFLVALHDIGKISTSFAGLNTIQKSRLIQEGFDFGAWTDSKNAPHATVGQVVLSDVFGATRVTTEASLLLALQTVVGGHHGVFVKQSDLNVAKQNLLAYEPPEWAALRASAAAFLKGKLVPADTDLPKSILNQSTAIAALTGFTILCDWIGSDANHFVPRSTAHPDAYLRESAARARTAVAACGLTERVLSASATEVLALFPKLNPPRPLQQAIDEIPDELLRRPCLAIIEAPTGEGKTETAFALAHRLAKASGTDELYCALPTMATSNQMFTRLQTYLHGSLGLTAHVSLVHGQAFLMEDELRIEPMDNGDGAAYVQPVEWFSSKKRALLAPFGTGTVDQGELAALNVRHAMLRMVGLAGKVVILDEVHAYDTYMTTIIERLLQWLSALGSSVVLLSATLPSRQREALMQAYGSHGESMSLETYPALTIASTHQPLYQVSPAAWQPDRSIQAQAFNIHEDAPEDKARWLIEQVRDSGCACWISNTVRRAQDVFEALLRLAPEHVDLQLLHSQLPLDERQQRELRLVGAYGRESAHRPERGIVVGTQVLEQSLDLDFDVMATDLPPIDLLLQRAGRLHRHTRPRPAAHAHPRLWINTVLSLDASASLGADGYVYDEYLLRQTWSVLGAHRAISLPGDYRTLVERVYGATPPGETDALRGAWQKLQDKQAKARQEADQRLLPAPDPDYAFTAQMGSLTFEEDETRADFIVAQTRLGEDSLNVIPLVLVNDTHASVTTADGTVQIVALNATAPRDAQLALLRRNLRISNHDAIRALREESRLRPHKLFIESSLLAGYVPLILDGGEKTIPVKNGVLTLRLDSNLGLVIRKRTNTQGQSE